METIPRVERMSVRLEVSVANDYCQHRGYGEFYPDERQHEGENQGANEPDFPARSDEEEKN